MNPRVLLILPVLSLLLACSSCGGVDTSAIATVSREIPASNGAGISPSDLAATPIPRGEGVMVYVKNRKTDRLAWVVLDGQAYVCNSQTKSLTPAVPYAKEARWDTWKRTGLDPENAAAFARIIDDAEARAGSR